MIYDLIYINVTILSQPTCPQSHPIKPPNNKLIPKQNLFSIRTAGSWPADSQTSKVQQKNCHDVSEKTHITNEIRTNLRTALSLNISFSCVETRDFQDRRSLISLLCKNNNIRIQSNN